MNDTTTTDSQSAAAATPLAVARSNAYRIARLACDEQQPMPSEGVDNRLIAEACEDIGEVYAKSILWFECATARRMACWYWRKALDE